MKIEDPKVELKDPKGNAITTRHPKTGSSIPLVLHEAMYNACWAELPEGSMMPQEARSQANKIAVKITMWETANNGPLDLTAEQVSILKGLAAIKYNTIVYGAFERALGEVEE